jgi:hypothetical protein
MTRKPTPKAGVSAGGKSRDYFDGGLTMPKEPDRSHASLERQAEKARNEAGKNKSNDQHKVNKTHESQPRHPGGKFR